MIIEYKPIGVIHSPFKQIEGMPIQASRAKEVFGTVELDPEFQEGLADVEGFSHLILIYHLHRSKGYNLKVVPFLDDCPRGLFATRAPKRPNPIGLSIVKLCGIEGCTLTIQDIDILDGTPLLDIKPYIEQFDQRTDVRCGWLAAAWSRKQLSDRRFE